LQSQKIRACLHDLHFVYSAKSSRIKNNGA